MWDFVECFLCVYCVLSTLHISVYSCFSSLVYTRRVNETQPGCYHSAARDHVCVCMYV